MAGDRNHVDHAGAEVDHAGVGRPLSHAEERAHRRGVTTNDGDVWPADELGVAGDVIAVSVAMRHHEVDRRAPLAGEPGTQQCVDRCGDVDVAGPGVEEQRTVVAEEEIEERLLVIRARRLAQDEEIRVVRLDPERRHARAVGSARVPRGGQLSRLQLWYGVPEMRARQGRDRDTDQ
jgi:hypothetical protein